MSWPLLTRSPSFTSRRTTLPAMSALIFTWVRGSIFPGARTRATMSSTRTRANCTAVSLPLPPRMTLTTTSASTSTTPMPIHSPRLPFIVVLPASRRSLDASAHAVELRLGDADPGERRDPIGIRACQADLRVDQIEDRGGADIVFLLRELEVL